MQLRAVVLTCCLLITAWYLAHAQTVEAVPAHSKIESMPLAFDGWAGRNSSPFSPQILGILGVDRLCHAILLASGRPRRRAVRRLLRKPAAGRHHALAAQLHARRGVAADVEVPAHHHGVRWRSQGQARRSSSIASSSSEASIGNWCCIGTRVTGESSPASTGEDLHRRRCIALQPDRRRARASHDAARRPAGSRRAGLRGSCRAIRAGAVSAARPIPA